MGIMCCMMLGSNVFRSSYVQAKTSLNSLKNLMNYIFSCSEHPNPKLMHCGLSLVPKFTFSCVKEELFILQFTDFLNHEDHKFFLI